MKKDVQAKFSFLTRVLNMITLQQNLMSKENKASGVLPKVLLGLAVIGFIFLWLILGGRYGHGSPAMGMHSIRLYSIATALVLILPYFIYLYTSKASKKSILKGNPIDLDKIGVTTPEYMEQKANDHIVEIYVKNETSDKLIVNRESYLEPQSWHVFTIGECGSVYFSNGIEFHIDKELSLSIKDYRNQIIGLKDDYFEERNVPEYVDWAFAIAEPGQGDGLE
jgi:hypothetical protein